MNMDDKIKRINELYHKSKVCELSDQEKEEQSTLRKEYIASIRGNLKNQLEGITIQRPDGTIEKLSKKNHGK